MCNRLKDIGDEFAKVVEEELIDGDTLGSMSVEDFTDVFNITVRFRVVCITSLS